MDNSKNRRCFGLVLMALAILMFLFFRFGLRYAANSDVFFRQIQNSIVDEEYTMQSCLSSPNDFVQYDKEKLGLIVYEDDSLIYWNTNSVGPKLIRRRVPLGCDTICNLLSGEYLVNSFADGNRSFYVFKLLNTNYSIDNEYFINRFWLFPFVLDVDIKFDSKSTLGYPICNSKNDVLTYCEIAPNPSLKPGFRSIIWVVVVLLLLIGLVFLISSFQKVQNHYV